MPTHLLITFLRKTTTLLFYLFAFLGIFYFLVSLGSIIINQRKGPIFASNSYYIEGFEIGRDASHQTDFYSKDKLLKISEKTGHYFLEVTPRSTFNYFSLLFTCVVIFLGVCIVWHFMKLLKQTNFKNPFDRGVVKRLKFLAALFISLDVLKILQSFSYSSFLSKSFPSVTVQGDLLFSIGGNILTGFIIWVIATIFQRGIELQEENALTV